MSIRTRLLAVSVLALALGLGVLLAVGNALFARTIAGDTDAILRTRAEAQIASLVILPSGVRVRGVPNDASLDTYAWIFSGGRMVERPARDAPGLDTFAARLAQTGRVSSADGVDGVRLRGQPLYARRDRRQVGAVVVGLAVQPFTELRRKVLGGSVAIALIVLAVAAFAIRRALLGALRPVGTMTAEAETWGANDLDRRFSLGEPRDELTGLAAMLDHLLERIAASRRHEQRFASEVAHELRTPLAAIRGQAELALTAPEHARAGRQADALTAIITHVERLTRTIDTLIAIARREAQPTSGTVDLRAVSESFDGVTVTVGGSVPPVAGDNDLVRQALAPLVDNARAHARSRVEIELTGHDGRARVAVLDDGPGVDPSLGDAIFEPGVRGPDAAPGGGGLGLALARRLVTACGGELRVGTGPGGCFLVELPAAGRAAAEERPRALR